MWVVSGAIVVATPGALDGLSRDERDRLAACEQTIAAGCRVFMEVGSALLAINEGRLYRETHESFETYVADRWDISRARAYQFMEAAGVGQILSKKFDTKRLRESHARVLASLPPEDVETVHKVVTALSPTGQPTAALYRAVASVCRDVADAGAVDPGTGEMVPWAELSPERRAAFVQTACTQELFEEHQRRHNHCVRVALSAGSYEWYTPPNTSRPRARSWARSILIRHRRS